jgi:hypothetical protein
LSARFCIEMQQLLENEQTNMSKLSVHHGKNIIVNSVWVFMIYAIVKAKKLV